MIRNCTGNCFQIFCSMIFYRKYIQICKTRKNMITIFLPGIIRRDIYIWYKNVQHDSWHANYECQFRPTTTTKISLVKTTYICFEHCNDIAMPGVTQNTIDLQKKLHVMVLCSQFEDRLEAVRRKYDRHIHKRTQHKDHI